MPCKNQIKPIVFNVTDRQISGSTYKSSIAYEIPDRDRSRIYNYGSLGGMMVSVARTKTGMQEQENNTPLTLEIGLYSIEQCGGNVPRALKKYRTHATEIVLASLMRRIEGGANHRDLRDHGRMLAAELDSICSTAEGIA